MKELLSIGELSKLQSISKQTLIFYDKIGLFCPIYKDKETGYRFYSIKQIDYLDTILIMKKMGLSLKEIKEFMKSYNIDESIGILKKQIPILIDQINHLEMIKSRVEHKCRDLENIKKLRKIGSKISIEMFDQQNIYIQKVKEPNTLEQVSIATKKCFVKAYQKNIPIFFQSGAIIPIENIMSGNYTLAKDVFLTCENNNQDDDVIQLPSGRVVTTYHIGDYVSIGKTYEKVLKFCKESLLEIISDSYEFAVNDYLSTRNESEYITKIVFYIKEV